MSDTDSEWYCRTALPNVKKPMTAKPQKITKKITTNASKSLAANRSVRHSKLSRVLSRKYLNTMATDTSASAAPTLSICWYTHDSGSTST